VGSLRAISDSSGTVIKQIDYDSFGNIINDNNPGFSVPFGFAGGLNDYDTGLVRFGFRDYDPAIGRWTAKDPIDFAGGDVNLFQYVQSDPVNFVDPLGLATFRNYSGGPVIYKHERNKYKFALQCPDNAWCDVDGLYFPDTEEIIKIPNGCTAYMLEDGELKVSCGLGPEESCVTKNIQEDDDEFGNWPNPFSGENWPFDKW
jgi:RHS repeat-associated protein